MYEPYAGINDYHALYKDTGISDEELEATLRAASRHIDSLTYNRIIGRGFSNLSMFQQEVIREVVCQQAKFEYENRDELDCILSGYSINGVSMTIQAGWNIFTDKGVAMKRDTYSLLEQTGLCCRSLRGCMR
jgi:hypothetical protein